MKNKIIPFFTIVSACLLVSSCNNETTEENLIDYDNDEVEFSLVFASRESDPTSDIPLENIDDYFTEGESCLLVSQRSTSLGLNFNEGSSNCYKYIYYKNESANWDSGSNFKSDNPFGWEKILANGQYSNGYAFAAMFFPKGYTFVDKISSDQSISSYYLESDILGAWHRITNIGDRIVFRLNHLMCRLHINLYVPILKTDKDITGFNENAIKEASTISFRTDFIIDPGERSSDDPPRATPSTTMEGETADIKMCLSESNQTPEELDLSDYSITGMDKDIVRKYTFDVLFPEQTVNGNFLRFILKRGDAEYRYVFNSEHLIKNAGGFQLQAGHVTQLNLYLPRTDQNLLLIGAEIINWNKADAWFTITPTVNQQ